MGMVCPVPTALFSLADSFFIDFLIHLSIPDPLPKLWIIQTVKTLSGIFSLLSQPQLALGGFAFA